MWPFPQVLHLARNVAIHTSVVALGSQALLTNTGKASEQLCQYLSFVQTLASVATWASLEMRQILGSPLVQSKEQLPADLNSPGMYQLMAHTSHPDLFGLCGRMVIVKGYVDFLGS